MFHSDTQRRLTGMLKQLGFAALYALLAYLSHLYFDSNGIISIFEPACGLALAILLIGGRQYAWGILLGALLVNVLSNSPFWVAVTIAFGNTLEALVAAWLLTRNGSFDLRLRSLRSAPITSSPRITSGELRCVRSPSPRFRLQRPC